METQEPEKIKEPEQIKTTVRQTVPKNPGRIAAGKNLLNTTKTRVKQRKKQKKSREATLKNKKKTLHQLKTKANKAVHFH